MKTLFKHLPTWITLGVLALSAALWFALVRPRRRRRKAAAMEHNGAAVTTPATAARKPIPDAATVRPLTAQARIEADGHDHETADAAEREIVWKTPDDDLPVEYGPYPGSAIPVQGGASPSPEFVVKGNQDSMLYHTPESPFFGVTKAEVWFRSEADAQRAGFAAWR